MAERLPPIDVSAMPDEQRKIYDEIGAARNGNVNGPFLAWLHVPSLADCANKLGNALRLRGSLSGAEFELAVMMVARQYRCLYAWDVHVKAGRVAGIDEPTIAAILKNTAPTIIEERTSAIYRAVAALLINHDLDDEVYTQLRRSLTAEQIVELVTVVGFYSMVCLVAKVFRIGQAWKEMA